MDNFLFENMQDAVSIIDPVNFRILGANRAFLREFGKTEDDLLQETCYSVMHGRTTPCPARDVSCPLMKAAEKGDRIVVEHVHIDRYGVRKQFEITASPVKDADGRVIRIVHMSKDISRWKETAEELKEQKEFAVNLVQNSTAPTFVLNADHEVVIWNRACEEMTGIAAKEVLGTADHWKAFYPAHRPCLADLIIDGRADTLEEYYTICGRSRSLASGYHAEGWYTFVNGEQRYILFDAAPIHNGRGELIAAIETFEDITELKHVEGQLSHRIEFDKLITGISSRFINLPLQEIDGEIQGALRTIGEFTAVDRGCIFLFEEDSGMAAKTHEWSAPDSDPHENDFRRISLDRELPWLAERLREKGVIHIPSVSELPPEAFRERSAFEHFGVRSLILIPIVYGNVLYGFMGFSTSRVRTWTETHIAMIRIVGEIISNVIARKRAKEAMLENQGRFRAITSTATDAIILVNDQGQITYWNPAAEAMFGYRADEAVGKELHAMIVPREAGGETRRTGLTLLTETGSGSAIGKTIEMKAIRRDGSFFPIEISTSAILIKNRWETAGIIRDITDRKKTEENIIKTQKLESLGLLAGGIAHDFNNYLSAMLSNLSLAKIQTSPGDKLREILEEAEKASLRAKYLTQQLITFSRGGMPVKKLHSSVALIRDSADFALRGSSMSYDFRFDEDLWNIEADEGQISQVINNLVVNAEHAMPQGDMLSIQAENVVIADDAVPNLGSGPYVKISFADRGTGIAEDHLAKIFDPYFSTKSSGSGLGLTTSLAIIQKHGGQITVETTPGIGTTFHVYIPAADKPLSADSGTDRKLYPGKGKILVMDDNDLIKLIVGRMLTELGYEGVFAENGEEAIKQYHIASGEGRPFDALLFDLTIAGGMGGEECLRHLLQIDPDLKAVVSSGYSEHPVMADYRKYGFQGMVMKPYQIEDLSAELHRILQQDPALPPAQGDDSLRG